MVKLTSSFMMASSTKAMSAALHDEGQDVHDFELEIGPLQAISDDAFLVVGPLLRIRRMSTDKERVYSVGASFTWLQPFKRNLRDGYFGGTDVIHSLQLRSNNAR